MAANTHEPPTQFNVTDEAQNWRGGHTDMKEHIRTWQGFMKFMKWQVIGIIILMALLAIFRTHN